MTKRLFKDHFSGHAAQYAAARPSYPAQLFEWLAGLVESHELVWDVATGNGQAANALATHFDRVYATDASAEQIAAATPLANIDYRCEPAERCRLVGQSVDLITVAQAAHWFNHGAFHAEARRVLKPGGVLAIWCYELTQVNSEIDSRVMDFYQSMDEFWPPERGYIESGYRTLPFPFAELSDVPQFELRCNWTADEFIAYLRSWSATQYCRRATGSDPLAAVGQALRADWGQAQRRVCWPLILRVGRLRLADGRQLPDP